MCCPQLTAQMWWVNFFLISNKYNHDYSKAVLSFWIFFKTTATFGLPNFMILEKTGKKRWAYTTVKRKHYLKSGLTNVGYGTFLYLECNAKLNHLWMIYQSCKLTLLQVETYQICLSLQSLKHSSRSMAQTKTYSLKVTTSKPESIFTYHFYTALELRYQGLQIRLTCGSSVLSFPNRKGNF